MRSVSLASKIVSTLIALAVMVVLVNDHWFRSDSHIAKTLNIEYSRPSGIPLHLDIYRLKESKAVEPVIVWIHGGAWVGGSRSNCPVYRLVENGYSVVSIDYRLATEARWPAQLEDARSAIEWIIDNAQTYGFDPKRIGVAGSSSGGHLAAMLALTSGNEKEPDKKEEDFDSFVKAACLCYAPSDLSVLVKPRSNEAKDPNSPLALLFGGPVNTKFFDLLAASPISNIRNNAPPFLLLHGDKDDIVPISHSILFHEALLKSGVDSEFRPIKNAGHGFKWKYELALIDEFFRRHLIQH